MHYSIFKQELGQMNTNVKSRIINAFVVGFLSFFISASWALSSPPGSSPDEDAHLTTAWCESKYGSNDCAEVPLKVVESGKCFFLDADSVPTCANEIENKQPKTHRILEGTAIPLYGDNDLVSYLHFDEKNGYHVSNKDETGFSKFSENKGYF